MLLHFLARAALPSSRDNHYIGDCPLLGFLLEFHICLLLTYSYLLASKRWMSRRPLGSDRLNVPERGRPQSTSHSLLSWATSCAMTSSKAREYAL